jgi:hypothetical protein
VRSLSPPWLAALPLVLASAWTAPASAADEPQDRQGVPKELPQLVENGGRVQPRAPAADEWGFQLHGEYQLRGQFQADLPLGPTATYVDANPGATTQPLGQNAFATNWLRMTPTFQWREALKVVLQFDVGQNFPMGQATQGVGLDQAPRDRSGDAFSYMSLRWLYLDWRTKYGLWRVGQQPNHWGLGVLTNDGDHPSVFGDYRNGALVERLLFATRPLGEKSSWVVALAGDLVYRDWNARLYRGDVALQAVVATYVEKGPHQLGVFAVYRNQRTQRSSADGARYDDALDVGVVDVAGKTATLVPGTKDTYLFGAAEAAVLFGASTFPRTPDHARAGDRTSVLGFGAAGQLGIVHTSSESKKDGPPQTWGVVVGQVELGWASGDADPYDGSQKRFTFDPNHKVGLLLFDEVMRWQTARSATAAADPSLANRPAPGADQLPSNGGVFGAQYVNPTAIVRPRPWLDLKAGMVFAQATADVVDPYRTTVSGSYVNYQGGDPRRRDLGVEVDLGTELRIFAFGANVQLGAQGGILFPGRAFADASGATFGPLGIFILRGGLQF